MTIRKTFTRRRFLTAAGVTLGATALTCSGIAALGSQQPDVAYPELTLGDASMSDRILVTYASYSGFTAGVAEAIGRTLAESGAPVDVRSMDDVSDVTSYRAVIAGSAVHGCKWLPEAMTFVKKHREALAGKPFAAFQVCMTMTMENETYREGIMDAMDPVRQLVRPLREGCFAGGIDFSKLGLVNRLILKGIVASGTWEAGDHRDWNAINAWAEEVGTVLV